MKWSISRFKTIYRILSFSSYFIVISTQAHIAIVPSNPDLYKIYSLNNTATNLLYHLESGTVHKENSNGLQNIYRNAHVMNNKIPAQAKVLGYINKNKNDNSERQYIYIELNKKKLF